MRISVVLWPAAVARSNSALHIGTVLLGCVHFNQLRVKCKGKTSSAKETDARKMHADLRSHWSETLEQLSLPDQEATIKYNFPGKKKHSGKKPLGSSAVLKPYRVCMEPGWRGLDRQIRAESSSQKKSPGFSLRNRPSALLFRRVRKIHHYEVNACQVEKKESLNKILLGLWWTDPTNHFLGWDTFPPFDIFWGKEICVLRSQSPRLKRLWSEEAFRIPPLKYLFVWLHRFLNLVLHSQTLMFSSSHQFFCSRHVPK